MYLCIVDIIKVSLSSSVDFCQPCFVHWVLMTCRHFIDRVLHYSESLVGSLHYASGCPDQSDDDTVQPRVQRVTADPSFG